MATAKTVPPDIRAAHFPPLDEETRTHVDTRCAAFHLNRKPRTLRAWAAGECPAPLQPAKRVNRLLYWAVDDLRRVLEREGA